MRTTRIQAERGVDATEGGGEIWSVQLSSVVVISLVWTLLTTTTDMIARSPHLIK